MPPSSLVPLCDWQSLWATVRCSGGGASSQSDERQLCRIQLVNWKQRAQPGCPRVPWQLSAWRGRWRRPARGSLATAREDERRPACRCLQAAPGRPSPRPGVEPCGCAKCLGCGVHCPNRGRYRGRVPGVVGPCCSSRPPPAAGREKPSTDSGKSTSISPRSGACARCHQYSFRPVGRNGSGARPGPGANAGH